MAKYPFKICQPASEVHITPGITSNSLLSTSKFAEADYNTVFNKEQVNIYDVNNVVISVTRGAILRGWRDPRTGLWRISLLPTIRKDNVTNVNTDMVLVNKPPGNFLKKHPPRPPHVDEICNMYELKTQPELVRYYHAAAGFPTKPTWIKAIKNKHYASWTGLTYEGVSKHYPESEETHKGHAQKLKSGQRSTKKKKNTVEPDSPHLQIRSFFPSICRAPVGQPNPTEMIPRASRSAATAVSNIDEEESNWPQPQEQCVMVRVVQLDVDDDDKDDGLLRVIYSNGTG
jgi:hypothetical protein